MIRHIALLAHTTDNNTSTGPAYQALIPNGLNAEVRPTGKAHVTVSTALRQRLAFPAIDHGTAGEKRGCASGSAICSPGGRGEARIVRRSRMRARLARRNTQWNF